MFEQALADRRRVLGDDHPVTRTIDRHLRDARRSWDGLVRVFATSSAVPDPVAYMDAAAATPAGVEYKQRLLAALQLRAGQVAVYIGCGPGTDLDALAAGVGRHGMVIGVDREPRMIGEARRRSAAQPNIRCCVVDIHQLPLPDGGVDRARTDRLLQHVRDPATAIRQVRRILRPGGLFGMAEPDWDTLAVTDEDVDTSRRFARFLASRVRNATIGRDLGPAVRRRRSAGALGGADCGALRRLRHGRSNPGRARNTAGRWPPARSRATARHG